jgi:biotin synthase-like enzyme
MNNTPSRISADDKFFVVFIVSFKCTLCGRANLQKIGLGSKERLDPNDALTEAMKAALICKFCLADLSHGTAVSYTGDEVSAEDFALEDMFSIKMLD